MRNTTIRRETAGGSSLRTAMLSALLGITALSAHGSEQLLNATLKEQSGSNQSSARSQIRVSQLADQATELLGEYRVTMQQLDRTRLYNNHLQKLVDDQERERASINKQLVDFEVVEKDIVPLMVRMIDDLDEFIKLDLPFQLEERQSRIQRLRDNMDRSNVTISEKYRQIMDAYQIETTFGRDIEAYPDKLPIDGVLREVEFFRVGRVLLAYQTADRSQTGFWNKNTDDWESLPDSYRNFVTEGIRIARKQAAPNLLRLPVPAARVTQ